MMNWWLITWAYTMRITATNPRAMTSSLRPNVVLEWPGFRTRRGPCGWPNCRRPATLRCLFLYAVRFATQFNDYSHLRGFRRVGIERVELLICLNMRLGAKRGNARGQI